MRAILIALAVMASGAAWAAELVEGRCHMRECSWIAVEEIDLAGSNDKGALFKVRTKTWTAFFPDGNYSVRRPRKYVGEDISYTFCSKTEPAIISAEGGKFNVSPLPLGQEDIQAGLYMTSIAYYFAVCHRMNVKQSDVFQVGTTKARELGYISVDPERSDFQVARVEEILKSAASLAPSRAPSISTPAPVPAPTLPQAGRTETPDTRFKSAIEKFGYCARPKIQYGQFSSFDGGKSAMELMYKCAAESGEFLDACKAGKTGGADPDNSCSLALVAATQLMIKEMGK